MSCIENREFGHAWSKDNYTYIIILLRAVATSLFACNKTIVSLLFYRYSGNHTVCTHYCSFAKLDQAPCRDLNIIMVSVMRVDLNDDCVIVNLRAWPLSAISFLLAISESQ